LKTCKRRQSSKASNRPYHTVSDIVCSASEAIEGLITTQIKLEVNIKMNKLATKTYTARLHPDIVEHLAPSQPTSRERIIKIALENMEGATSTDLTAKVSQAVESAILDEFHKGVDKQMRDYMK
jgi:hypothetical protein